MKNRIAADKAGEYGPSHLPKKVLIYVSVFFFLSGMCGLIYQILWTRILSLLFGHTTFAVGTVLTAFMGGLALGSYYVGRWADADGILKDHLKKRGGSPLLLAYAFLEVSVGIYCLLTPFLFTLVEHAYLSFVSLPFFAINILRFLLCTLVLIVPTFLMGGTLPVLSKFFIVNFSEFGSKLGRLYCINTFGAAAGSFAAGFFLLRILGLDVTLQSAAVINIGIGLLTYILNKQLAEPIVHAAAAGSGERQETGSTISPSSARLIFFLFAFTGFASMIYEISWTRALALALGSSIYAFASMLTTFLLGIALGSMIFSRVSRRRSFTVASFGWLEVLTAFFCLLSIPLLGEMPIFFVKIFPLVSGSYEGVVLADFLLCFLVMIVPTILMGFVFPLVGMLYTQNMNRLGRSVGDIYAVNTLGCILGSFLASFVMIPFLGVQNSLKMAITINLLCGLIVLYLHYPHPAARITVLSSAIASVLLSGFIPGWNPAVMTSGAAVYATRYAGASTDSILSKEKNILFYRDGISSTVSVHRSDKNIYLKVNGKTDASTEGDMPTQLMLGYLPMIHHRDPKDVFIIGLGSGVTAKAVLDFAGASSVLCAELEPAVVEANSFFSEFNGHILQNPRFKIKIEDGRNALLASKGRYDVIISEPSNPWIAGIANLYSSEFYEIGKNRLKKAGIFCQWFHLYSMDPSDVKMVLKTFFSVFRYGTVWTTANSDLILLGSDQRMVFDYARWEDLYHHSRSIRKSMDGIKLNATDAIFSFYITDSDSLRPLFKTAYLNTDNLPILEFSAPRNLYADTSSVNLRGLIRFKKDKMPPVRGFRANQKMSHHYYVSSINQMNKIGVSEMSSKILNEGLSLHPRNFVLRIIRVKTLIQENRMLKAEEELRHLITDFPDQYLGYAEMARFYKNQGFPEKVNSMYERAFQRNHGDEDMNAEFINFLMDRKRYEKASFLLERLRTEYPNNVRYENLSGVICTKTGDYPRAIFFLQGVLNKNPGRYDTMRHLFMIYREQGNLQKLIEIGSELRKKNPNDRDVMTAYGRALMETGQPALGREILIRVAQSEPYGDRISEDLTKTDISR